MQYLKDSGATVIAMRALAHYVDCKNRPKDAFASIVRRLGLAIEKPTCDTTGAVPRFSWQLASNGWTQNQVAYRILVASSRKNLDRDQGDLWDSGKVDGEESTGIAYAGKKLSPGTDYWWKVQCWNQRERIEIAKHAPYQSKELITELHKSRPGPFSTAMHFKP